MAKKRNIILIVVALIAVVIIAVIVINSKKVYDFHDKYEGADLTKEIAGAERNGTYSKYLVNHAADARPSQDAEVDLFSYDGEGDVTVENDYNGFKALLTQPGSEVTWTVNVPEAGLYNLYL